MVLFSFCSVQFIQWLESFAKRSVAVPTRRDAEDSTNEYGKAAQRRRERFADDS
jgi:hypothetical protein